MSNPAKTTDSRYRGYAAQFGVESWELDALNPEILTELINTHMTNIVHFPDWEATEAVRDEGRRLLGAVADRWDKLTKKL